MISITPNINLIKPDSSEFYDVEVQNGNMDKIDAAIKAVSDHGIPYGGTSTSVGNAYTIETPDISTLVEGMAVSFKCNADSSGAVTLNWDGKGAKAILKSNGSAVTNLKAGGIYTVRYGGTAFILQGEGGEYGTATPAEVLTGFTLGTESGLVNGTLALTGDAVAANVLSGKTFYNTNAKTKVTGTIPSKTAQTYTPSTVNQTIAANQFLSGIQTILGDPDLIAANIKSGVDIFGVVGSIATRIATGTVVSDLNITITGLDFEPDFVLFIQKAQAANRNRAQIVIGTNKSEYKPVVGTTEYNVLSAGNDSIGTAFSNYSNNNYFFGSGTVILGGQFSPGNTYKWIAVKV